MCYTIGGDALHRFKSPAKHYCDSNQASLSWSCDNKVYIANFLVARQSRSLLRYVCWSSMPLAAFGEKLRLSRISKVYVYGYPRETCSTLLYERFRGWTTDRRPNSPVSSQTVLITT
ncbi:hypothetical protein R6Q59_025891 [Mikania micrantha]